MPIRGVVFGFAPGDIHRAGRTQRSLTAAGVAAEDAPALGAKALACVLRGASDPVLLARAGSWLASPEKIAPIPSSETGRPLIACGANPSSPHWTRHLARCGGDFQRRSWLPRLRALPEPDIVYLEAAAQASLATLLEDGSSLREALHGLMRDDRFRAVHLAALDGYYDSALRVLQLVTTIQVGGAERVTLDLAEELTRQGVRVCVAAFGRPARLAFPRPVHFADLSAVPNHPEERAEAVAALAREMGADLVHAHLIRATEARAIRARGLPLAMTLHNMPSGWPAGLREDPLAADLIFACSRAVEVAWHDYAAKREDAGTTVRELPIRTLWNGIDPKPYEPSSALRSAGAAWRARLGWAPETFVIAAIANPRAQKRLHLLPEILRELQALLAPRAESQAGIPESRSRPVRLIIAGAHGDSAETLGAEAWQAVTEVDSAISRCGVAGAVHWTGGTHDVAPILAASDALVSTSAFEGLSLAHLEALAAGVPVVATDVGGASEISRQSALLHLLPASSAPLAFARRLAELALPPATRSSALPASFTRYRMADRARRLYPRVMERARPAACSGELWLITNNFSTGGAQSSARRLLLGLRASGVKVRAFTVQEAPAHPTPGRAALLRTGIPVTALPPPEQLDAADVAARILDEAAAAPPRAVLFWNLIASYKILLADGFFGVPLFDVSPGEMYYSSLAKYFAQPRPGLPCTTLREYGARLAGVVVKYAAEARAAAQLGAPVHVIRNGIAIAENSGAAEPPHRRYAGPLVIGTAARISPDKRLEDLLEAFRRALPRLPRCALHIAGGVERGSEDYAKKLRREARGLPIRWRGELPGTGNFLRELDFFAMISEPAGCPNASLEAMAAGLPIIATDAGGAREQVLDGITGRLTPRGDHEAFASALIELAHDADLRARYGRMAFSHVREHFSLAAMVDNYRRLCIPERPLGPEPCTDQRGGRTSRTTSGAHSLLGRGPVVALVPP